jgi:hypothetical protein
MTLSVPSYVIPGTYGENVEFLADRREIQAVELLFYYFDDESRDLFVREKSLIASYRERFTFAVHMPDSLLPQHERLIELTRDLAQRYILHSPPGDLDGFRDMVEGWQERYGRVFFVENLIAEMMSSFPLCCDTGHLLRSGSSVEEFIKRYGPRIQEIHLHGVRDGADHQTFAAGEPWFQELVPFLRAFDGVVNIEVFSIGEVDAIVSALAEVGVLPKKGF